MSAPRRRRRSRPASWRAGGRAKGYRLRWVAEDADDLSGDERPRSSTAATIPITKFAVADWAVATGKPYVIAAALRFGGNVLVGAPGTACYRCLFEEPVAARYVRRRWRARSRRRRDRWHRRGTRARGGCATPRTARSARSTCSTICARLPIHASCDSRRARTALRARTERRADGHDPSPECAAPV